MLKKHAGAALALLLLVTIAACGDGGSDSPSAARESFEEGELRIEIEILDTGLLKGHAYADAAEGWRVTGLRVEAHDPGGAAWRVIEPERTGVGTASASEFFEVVIQELPRSEQLTVEAIATFGREDGSQVERKVVDKWPP